MRATLATAALLVWTSLTVIVATASPSNSACAATSSLTEAEADCAKLPLDQEHVVQATQASGAVVVLTPVCGVRVGGACGRVLSCITTSDSRGVLYDVTVDGEAAGRHCIGDAEAAEAAVVTPSLVQRAMRRLDWPGSDLIVEPPDGVTLVNLDTNFYTTDTASITRRVTLLGQAITIEARPATFTWHFGDGEARTTTEGGAAYPDLQITHNYRRKDTYRVRLDTTYDGRFRVGNGPWQAIPGTVTIAGTAQQLQAIEARPTLVAP